MPISSWKWASLGSRAPVDTPKDEMCPGPRGLQLGSAEDRGVRTIAS